MKRCLLFLSFVLAFTFLPKYVKASTVDQFDVNEMLNKSSLIKIEDDGLVYKHIEINNDGETAETVIKVVPKDEEAMAFLRLKAMAKSGSRYDESWDSSTTAKIYSTIYYDTSVINGATYVTLNRVVGGYTISGANGTVPISQAVELNQMGTSPSGSVTYKTPYYPDASRKSWTYYRLSTWKPVLQSGAFYISCNSSLQLQRPGGSTWMVYLYNKISNQF